MKATSGFITDDGTFFADEFEAALYEAEMKLRGKLAIDFPQANAENFLAVVLATLPEMRSYINAHDAAATNKRDTTKDEDGTEVDNSTETEADNGVGHVSSAEKDLASLLELPTRRPQHVPDVGRRPRTKKVQDRRKVDGA